MHTPDRSDIFTVFVNGEQWLETPSFETATQVDKVYVLDETSGAVMFGDGERGQQPKAGAEIVVTYRAGNGDRGNLQVSVTTTWPPKLYEASVGIDRRGIHILETGAGVESSSGEKRVRYFFGQILSVEDLDTEQQYHLRMQRRHNKMLHGPGVVAGLNVKASSTDSATTVSVDPGYAIDAEGHELILHSCVELAISGNAPTYYVIIQHIENQTDWIPMPSRSEPIASRIEDGVKVRLAADFEQSVSLVIGKIVPSPSGWEVDQSFQPLRPR